LGGDSNGHNNSDRAVNGSSGRSGTVEELDEDVDWDEDSLHGLVVCLAPSLFKVFWPGDDQDGEDLDEASECGEHDGE